MGASTTTGMTRPRIEGINVLNTYYTIQKLFIFSDNLWWVWLGVDGPIVKYICDKAIENKRNFVICGGDVDDYIINNNVKRKMVSCINKNSNKNTCPIPQDDNYFIKKYIVPKYTPYYIKKNEIIWRGDNRGLNSTRDKFVKYATGLNFPVKFNIKFTDNGENRMTVDEQINYKYIISIDGFGWPGSITWTMLSGCVPLIISNNHVWFMKLLIPWEDYVPITYVGGTFPDLYSNILRLSTDNWLCEKISHNAPIKMKKILTMQKRYIDLILSTEHDYDYIINVIRHEMKY